MTLSTSTPLRSVTARPLTHITTTTTGAETLSSGDGSSPVSPPLPPSSPPPLPPVDDASLSASMRSFAVIICNECFYLEFPGCDIHGILYTERALSDEKAPLKLHAKCPKCTAATNNVRPFREGCRRCKTETTVYMWCSTRSEIANAHEAFPPGNEEIAHTALTCELCLSVVFPRAREALTTRTAEHAMTSSNGKALQVSNFQLSMPHVEGCSRKGMPLQTVSVQLTKSELKFVLERIEQCPFTFRLQGGKQYRKRTYEVVTQQNHAHQIYLRLLSAVVKIYDPRSPNAMDALQKIVALFDRMEPLALFHEWSPPRVLSTTQHKPSRVEASSTLDEQHSPDNVVARDESLWRPKACVDKEAAVACEWIQSFFNPPVAMASIELRWHTDFRPAKYSVAITTEDNVTETVAVVIDGRSEQTLLFAQRTAVTSARISIYADVGKAVVCGLRSAVFHEAGVESQHTATEAILHDLQQWLLRASLAPDEKLRDTALLGLQKLTLACGSLCGLVHLATALILNVAPDEAGAANKFHEQEWNRLDRLQPAVRTATGAFITQLATNVLRIMVKNDTPDAGENSLVEKHVLEQMMRTIGEPVALEKNANSSRPSPAASLRLPSPKAVCASNEGEQSESPLYPYMTMAACQSAFSDAITRRSQLGMVVLMILSELSAWQMKRMQKAEEYVGKKEEELMQLEEPYSLEVRPQFFDLSHRLLCHVLSTWVAAPASVPTAKEETKSDDSDGAFDQEVTKTAIGTDLYNMLLHSFGELGATLGESGYLGSSEHNRRPTFTPDVMCGSILQIITSNIRRLVLSRVDPVEICIETPVPLGSEDLLSAPPALQPMVATLEQLIALGTKRSDKFFPLSLKAAAAVEVGMEAFYPSAHQRTKLLRSRMGKGATLEVQVRWPVQERDQEDLRYERLILMLQFECIRTGFKHAIRGRWQFYMHLVVEVPALQDTEDVLHNHFASCIQQAGFSSWQVVAGAQEILINLQRHLHWNRVEKMSHDSGSGWIRVYPRDVAKFDDVLSDVDLFLSDHDKRSAAKAEPRP